MIYILGFLWVIAFHVDSTQIKMESYIYKNLPGKWSKQKRTEYSKKLAERIIVESKYFNLDPIALTAIARIESNYLYFVSRHNDDSHGLFQSIRLEDSTLRSAEELAGCNYSHVKTPYLRLYASVWARKLKRVGCFRQDIASLRKHSGYFKKKEFKNYDPTISVYVAAREISLHVGSCRERNHKHRISGCRLPLNVQRELAKYGHYNGGPFRLRYYYLYRLCKYYTEILGE